MAALRAAPAPYGRGEGALLAEDRGTAPQALPAPQTIALSQRAFARGAAPLRRLRTFGSNSPSSTLAPLAKARCDSAIALEQRPSVITPVLLAYRSTCRWTGGSQSRSASARLPTPARFTRPLDAQTVLAQGRGGCLLAYAARCQWENRFGFPPNNPLSRCVCCALRAPHAIRATGAWGRGAYQPPFQTPFWARVAYAAQWRIRLSEPASGLPDRSRDPPAPDEACAIARLRLARPVRHARRLRRLRVTRCNPCAGSTFVLILWGSDDLDRS